MFAHIVSIPIWAFLPFIFCILAFGIVVVGHLIGAQHFKARDNYMGGWALIFTLLLAGMALALSASSVLWAIVFGVFATASLLPFYELMAR
jgi:hypothetical protein